MRISVDIDGVLLDLVGQVCRIYNKQHNADYSKKDVSQWEFFRDWNISEESIYEIFNLAYQNSAHTSLVDDGAPCVLKELNKTYNVDLVTARDEQYKEELLARLSSLNIKMGAHYENLIHVKTKPYDVKLGLNYDFYIDDNPYLAQYLKIYENKTLILYDQPWNQKIDEDFNIIRVSNWNQIGKVLLLRLNENPITEFLKFNLV